MTSTPATPVTREKNVDRVGENSLTCLSDYSGARQTATTAHHHRCKCGHVALDHNTAGRCALCPAHDSAHT